MASTGRSGTRTLQAVFDVLPNSVSFHEPGPILNGDVLQRYNDGDDDLARRVFLTRKVPRILQAAAFKTWYLETNHMFIKCFANEAAHYFGDRLKVIHLYRRPEEVASSFLYRGSIPGTSQGNDWTLNYRAARNEIQIADELSDGGQFSHDFYRCLWYWYETEARLARFRLEHPNVFVYSLATEDINRSEPLAQLVKAMRIDIDGELIEAVVGTRENSSPTTPTIPEVIVDEELQEFHTLCRSKLEQIDGLSVNQRTAASPREPAST